MDTGEGVQPKTTMNDEVMNDEIFHEIIFEVSAYDPSGTKEIIQKFKLKCPSIRNYNENKWTNCIAEGKALINFINELPGTMLSLKGNINIIQMIVDSADISKTSFKRTPIKLNK